MNQTIRLLTMTEVNAMLNTLTPQDLLLDVREPEEFREGRVPGSRNIPLGVVGNHADELKDKQKVIIYCRSGRRAQVAWEELTGHGLNNLYCVADGGMLDWNQNGYPIEKS